jgi:RNA polymerase sigma-32 factor
MSDHPDRTSRNSDSAPAKPTDSKAGSWLPAPAPTDRAVEPVDALTQYMAHLRAYPPISREEEHELAVRWVEEGDLDAARRLVLANLRLVVKIAMEYRRAWTNVLDLIQDGNIGLMEAVQRYDPYRGVKLSSYAVYWIRAFILKHIIDNFRMVRMGKTRAERKLFYRLNKEKRELELQGFEAGPRLLAERLEVSEDEVIDMERRLAEGDVSLNAPARRDEAGAEFGDFVPLAGTSAEENVANAELLGVFHEKVNEFAATLNDRDRQIVEERILAERPRTLRELGDEFGVSRERIRQIEAGLVSRLREFLKENLVDFEYYAVPKD